MYYLITKNTYWEYESLKSLVENCIHHGLFSYYRGIVTTDIGHSFNEKRITQYLWYDKSLQIFKDPKYNTTNYIVIDEYDRIIQVPLLKEIAKDIYNHPIQQKKWKRKVRGYFKYRYDPVPGVKGRWHYYGKWKSGLRLQEQRRNFEDRKFCKVRFTNETIIDPWDDIPKSIFKNCQKTWKRLKIKKQYMKHFKY